MVTTVMDNPQRPQSTYNGQAMDLIELIGILSHFDSPLEEIFSSVDQFFHSISANNETVMLSSLGLKGGECQITYQHSHAPENSWKCIDLLNTSADSPTYTSDFIASINDATEPMLLEGLDKSVTGFPQELNQYRSALVLPIYLNGVSKHKLVLFFKKHFVKKQWRDADKHMETLMLVANLLMSYLIHNCEIKSLNDANKWIEKEVSEVGDLLKMLLPQQDEQICGVDVATSYKPCEHAGGDYYDLVSLTKVFWPERADGKNDYWGAIIVDSAGHGAAAAVEVAMFDAILRTYKGDPDTGPAGVFNYANPYLFTRLIRGTFLTAFIANYNPFNKCLRFCSAGHPPALLIRAGGTVEWLDNPKGIPLAVTREFQWQNGQVDFNPDDVLILYTDGVTEASAPDGTLFGTERLKSVALAGPLHPNAIIQRVESALAEHQHGQRQKDDQTLIIIKLLSTDTQ
jgi:serine phosphatase RsbU (regulator of sigma subunit)